MLRKIIFISAGVLLLSFPAHGGEFSLSGLLNWYSGKLMYRDITNTSYFYPTLSYKTSKYAVSLSLPLISQNTNWGTFAGGRQLIALDDTYRGNWETSGHEYGLDSDSHSQYYQMNWRVGDLYFNVERTLTKETHYLPAFSATAQVKIPTASTALNLGTGAADYGFGVSASKSLGMIYGYGDVSFYFLGDPADNDFKNPMEYGVGIGLPASNDNVNLVAYYSAYTEIVKGFKPPKELFISVNYRLNSKYLLTSGISYGFSESSPQYGFFFGGEVGF